jgi:hypothetical protein
LNLLTFSSYLQRNAPGSHREAPERNYGGYRSEPVDKTLHQVLKEIRMTMTTKEIARARRFFGPAPILSSEEPELFEEFFLQLANDLKPQGVVELLLIWHLAQESWNLNRYARHSAVAVERRRVEDVLLEMQYAPLQHAQKKAQILAEIRRRLPTDVAALAETMDSLPDDMREIYERKKTERDHNLALARTMVFQERLDKLINSATRRRDGALAQLELYRTGLGAQAKATADQILEGEFNEVIPVSQAAKLISPGQHVSDGAELAKGRPQ